MIQATFASKSLVHPGAFALHSLGFLSSWLLIALKVPRPDLRLQKLGEEATSAARNCARYHWGPWSASAEIAWVGEELWLRPGVKPALFRGP